MRDADAIVAADGLPPTSPNCDDMVLAALHPDHPVEDNGDVAVPALQKDLTNLVRDDSTGRL